MRWGLTGQKFWRFFCSDFDIKKNPSVSEDSKNKNLPITNIVKRPIFFLLHPSKHYIYFFFRSDHFGRKGVCMLFSRKCSRIATGCLKLPLIEHLHNESKILSPSLPTVCPILRHVFNQVTLTLQSQQTQDPGGWRKPSRLHSGQGLLIF